MEQGRQAPGPDEMYCWSCGSLIKKDTELCMTCGVRARRRTSYPAKDKAVSVLLAIFLSFWTWLYTYKRDNWKFWVGLGLTVAVFNPAWTWLILFTPNIGIWIWAVVDVSVKPRQFYENY